MKNMEIYDATKCCPDNALKEINAGRLKGKSDINPMWRIKKLTELFGACGVGWYYDITKQWIEAGAKSELAAFCNINLFIKVDGEWSKPIQGTGGSMFVASEKNGLYTSDECFKMALTDAISVACKALGFAADVYWDKDKTKYDQQRETAQQEATALPIKESTYDKIQQELKRTGIKVNADISKLTEEDGQKWLKKLATKKTVNSDV